MSTPGTWVCPGCGAIVALPEHCLGDAGPLISQRLDQLARAACGCWVAELPETAVLPLLEALTAGSGPLGLPWFESGARTR